MVHYIPSAFCPTLNSLYVYAYTILEKEVRGNNYYHLILTQIFEITWRKINSICCQFDPVESDSILFFN